MENRFRIEIRLRLILILFLGRYCKNVYNCKKVELYEDEFLFFIIYDRNIIFFVNFVCIKICKDMSKLM